MARRKPWELGGVPAALLMQRGGGKVHGPFTPAAIPGLAAWYKADLGPLNAAGQAPAPTDPIATWVDQSGNGHNLTQPAGNQHQPTYSTNLQNGLHYVSFNGGGPQFALYANFAPFGAAGGDGTIVVAMNDRSVDGIGRAVCQGSVTGGVDFGIVGNGVPSPHCWSLFAAAGELDDPTPLVPDTFYCMTGVVSAGAAPQTSLRKNGVVVASGPLVLPWSGGDNIFILGANPAQTAYLNGVIAEVCVWPRALASGELAAVEGYLSAKWGLGF